MGRLILLGLALLVLVWLLRRALGGTRDGAAGAPAAPADLIACAQCGVLVPRAEAREAAGNLFCSDEHVRLGPRRP